MKKSPLKKKSSSKPSVLKRKLWKATSDYIRTRDKGTCFTCGRQAHGSAYHAGHFIPDAVGGVLLRYDERNIHGQCFNCNINLGGFGAMYSKKMIERYGQETVDELWQMKHKVGKWGSQEYLEKTIYYQEKLKTICPK